MAGVLSSGGVTLESISSRYLSTTGVTQSTIAWHADRDGQYSVRVGASNCTSGTVLSSGTTSTYASISSVVGAAALSAGNNAVWICVVPLGNSVGFAQLNLIRDDTAPIFSGLASVALNTATQVTLSWNGAIDGASAQVDIVYDIYQATATGAENYTAATYTSNPGATSYVVTGLTPATQYFFVVRARDQAGNHDTNTAEKNANAFFVDQLTGSDSNPGTSDMPKLTIQNAITASQAEGLARPVLVSKAVYTETVTLAAGVSLYGGYDRAANWTRNVAANTTSIISSNANVAAVTSSSGAITNTTVVSGFWITGSSNGTKPSGIEISAGNPNITNNTINGGATIQTNPSSAVAVRISGGNPTVQNCSINGGTQKGAGFTAGVYVSAGSATIRNNTIDGGNSNQAGCAGATNFGVRADVVFKLIGNTIRAGITGAAGCGSNTHSYGVQLKGGAAVVSNNTITAGAVVGPGINKYTAGIDCIACAAAIRNNTIVAGTGAAAGCIVGYRRVRTLTVTRRVERPAST